MVFAPVFTKLTRSRITSLIADFSNPVASLLDLLDVFKPQTRRKHHIFLVRGATVSSKITVYCESVSPRKPESLRCKLSDPVCSCIATIVAPPMSFLLSVGHYKHTLILSILYCFIQGFNAFIAIHLIISRLAGLMAGHISWNFINNCFVEFKRIAFEAAFRSLPYFLTFCQ